MADREQHGSKEQPIMVTEAGFEKKEYIRWYKDYIDKRTVLSKIVSQKLHINLDVYIDELLVREANCTEHVFWFDVSAAMLASKKAAAERDEKMKALDAKIAERQVQREGA
jgi:hypothetical protein